MPKNNFYALILAGGRGTRFWPKSRTKKAKQVLDFLGEGTLIQQTVARLRKVVPPDRILILTNGHLRDEIIRQLPDVPKQQILAEPAQRNTAPAIGLAARILQDRDPDAVMGVFPADHFIAKPAPFLKLVKAAYKEAAKGSMALIGIKPRWAETGYGYVEFGKGAMNPGSLEPTPVLRFREKPDAKTAAKFVKAGNYCWNAGMFFWRADTYLCALRNHLPETASLIDSLQGCQERKFGKLVKEAFPRCQNISVDYAVLEKARDVVGFVAGDIGWNDVGSWNAIYELLPKDARGNAARGETLIEDGSGNLVDAAPGKLVALLGVEGLVVVDTPDALMVCRREDAQRVGELVKLMEKQGRVDLL